MKRSLTTALLLLVFVLPSFASEKKYSVVRSQSLITKQTKISNMSSLPTTSKFQLSTNTKKHTTSLVVGKSN